MKDLNRVQLIGHLGQDPELKYTGSGTARTTFSVATSARWKDAGGQVQEATEWSRCVAWGTLAEVCAQYVNKGSRVYVAGRLHTLRWEDVETGEHQGSGRSLRYKVVLACHRRAMNSTVAKRSPLCVPGVLRRGKTCHISVTSSSLLIEAMMQARSSTYATGTYATGTPGL